MGAQPTQTAFGRRRRLVLAADPTGVTDLVDDAKQIRVVDFAGARLVATRIVRELHVSDPRQVFAYRIGEFTFHTLHVIDVVLQKEVVGAGGRNDVQRLLRVVEIKTGNVVSVDRLGQQAQSRALEGGGREFQVGNEGRAHPLGIYSRGRNPGEAIQLFDAQRPRISDRLADTLLEFSHAIRMAGDAAFAGGPLAGRQVVQDQFEAMRAQTRGELVGRVLVRKQKLDGTKPGLRGRLEAIQERPLVEQHGQIGSELGHLVRAPRDRLRVVEIGEDQSRRATAVGASRCGSSASSSNSLIASISVPIAILVTRSSMISITTGTRYSTIHLCACSIAGSISSCVCTRIALQPRPSTTLTWSTP